VGGRARLKHDRRWMCSAQTAPLVTAASIGSTSGMFDLGRRAWSSGDPDPVRATARPVPRGRGGRHGSRRVSRRGGRTTGVPGRGAAGGWTRRSGRPTRGERFPAVHGHRRQLMRRRPSRRIRPRGTVGRLRTICMVQPGQCLVEGSASYAGSALRRLGIKGPGRPRAARPGYTWLEQLRRRCARSTAAQTERLAPADAWTWAHGSRRSRPRRRPGRAERRGPSRRPPPTHPRLTAG